MMKQDIYSYINKEKKTVAFNIRTAQSHLKPITDSFTYVKRWIINIWYNNDKISLAIIKRMEYQKII